MEVLNEFSEGANSDLSKTKLAKNAYLQAINFRSLTEVGSSNTSRVNIRGNECKITFPELQPIYKIRLKRGTSDSSNSQSITLTINGQSTSLVISNGTTGLVVYNQVIANLTNCFEYTGTTPSTATFSIAYSDDYVTISQQPIYQDCGPSIDSIDPVITITQTTNDDTLATLEFIGQASTSFTQIPYITNSNNLIIIGSTFIGDDIYLFTAVDDPSYTLDDEFNDTFTKPGSIWKLNIDDITRQATLRLIYSNNIDFTKYHPIPPSAVSGRYESIGIQRIYWSDNFNKIRTLNVGGTQLMALDPTLLSVQPNVDFQQPILNDIIAGSLDAGCYQVAYRLTKTLGSVTTTSELSNPVYLTTSSESSDFEDYEGNPGSTSKGIQWKVDGLDTSFDNIEWIVTYRDSEFAIPTITSLGLTPIENDGSMIVDYTDSSTSGYTELTLEEFLLFNATFTHAKTVDTKDNRLFWGNVRVVQKELVDYDSRAFRANDAGEIKLTNSGVNTAYTYNQAIALAETEDTINEYYNTTDGDYSPNACYLKPSTATTTKILGGEGVNISYEFGTEVFEVDNNSAIVGSTVEGWDLFTYVTGSPYRTNGTLGNVNKALVYSYPQNNSWPSLKKPERTSLLKGFQHEEIYRFGIQFFDKQGTPFFTKWIGDIKMPSYGDTNSNPGGSVNDFRLTYQGASNNTFAQILYIKFTVDISSIENIIGGYEIVRVERTTKDRTICGVGIINPIISQDADDDSISTGMLPAGFNSEEANFTTPGPVVTAHRYYKPYPSQETCETLNIDTDNGTDNPNFGRFKTFDCFDMDLGNRPSFGTNDRILIRSRIKSMNFRNTAGGYRQFYGKDTDSSGNPIPGTTTNIDDGTAPPFIGKSNNDNTFQPFFIMKMVDDISYCNYQDFITSNTNQQDHLILNSDYVAGNSSTTAFSGGYTLYNAGLDFPTGILSPTDNPCGGKQTLFLDIGNNKDNSATGLYTSNAPYSCISTSIPFYKLLALYYKPNINLYGGPTYADRTQNEYIPCSEYIPVILQPSNNEVEVLGGDTFTTMQDMMKTFKGITGASYYTYDYNPSIPYNYIGLVEAKAKFSTSFFFCTTGVKNSELRLGNHPNKSIVNDGGYGEDDYLYETYNNAANNIKKYFPKPLDFQNTNEWRARVYYSEIKFDNETTDSWSQYLTNSFHDCEGTYGGINALITLNDQIYYLQDRAIGMLLINPIATVDAGIGTPVQLGSGATIQKHSNIAIDVGTQHQWSVYRSQSQFIFLDARHKKLYTFNGGSINPISDKFGQRNFIIKRLHNNLLVTDNPIISKGVISTYDYYHNEFIITFLNENTDTISNNTDEFYTIAFSEPDNRFTDNRTYQPNIYINSNKYLLSNVNSGSTTLKESIYLHNYGEYGMFYGVVYPSTIKLLVNDAPNKTKVFDDASWVSETINDNVLWSDDLNIYPGAITNPSYPDDVNYLYNTFNRIRCYNGFQNTDWIDLTTTKPNNNLRRVEGGFNLQLPRNKVDYDNNPQSTFSIFDPSVLTKTTFGERLRDKWLVVDLSYSNSDNLRFIIHNFTTLLKVSDR